MNKNLKKKILSLMLSSTLILSACSESNSEENEIKSEEKYETVLILTSGKALVYNGSTYDHSTYITLRDIDMTATNADYLVFDDYELAIATAEKLVGIENIIYYEVEETNEKGKVIVLK